MAYACWTAPYSSPHSSGPETHLDLWKRHTLFGEHGFVTSLMVRVERKTDHRKATVVWTPPVVNAAQPVLLIVKLEKFCGYGFGFEDEYGVDSGRNRFEFPDGTLESGQRYRVTVKLLKLSTRPAVAGYSTVGEKSVEFRTDLTMAELRRLHKKAKHSVSSSTTCRWLYRNKSPEYFSNIFHKKGGIMKVYVKDNSGDPASAINGQINGLFFMAAVERGTDGEPCRRSAFGSTRLQVPIGVLLAMAPNLYFSDYYCMKGHSHYVTLVATKTGSCADKFCRDHLLPLGIHENHDNPFLFVRNYSEMRVAVGTIVELLFTEDIDINGLLMYRGAEIIEDIPTIGTGSSTEGGVPKNPRCSTCNLRHPQFYDYDSDDSDTNSEWDA